MKPKTDKSAQSFGAITDLKTLCLEFKHWRESRAKRSHIPQHLWEQAVELARRYGVSKVANALKINHARLRCHCNDNSHALPSLKDIPVPINFVTMPSPAWLTPSAPQPLCVVELSDASDKNRTMRITFNQAVPDVNTLIHAFWSHP